VFRAKAERIAEGCSLPLEAFTPAPEPPPLVSWTESWVAGQHYSSGPPPREPPGDDPWCSAPPAGYHYEETDPFSMEPPRLVKDAPPAPAGYLYETDPFGTEAPRMVKDRWTGRPAVLSPQPAGDAGYALVSMR
jgi:hypothetical protein